MAEPIRKARGERRELHPTLEPVIEAGKEKLDTGEHRDAVRSAVHEQIEMARQQMSTVPAVGASDEDTKHTKHISALEQPQQVAYLGKIALEDGVAKAVRLAEKTGSEYVVDALHDLLVDELSTELERRHRT